MWKYKHIKKLNILSLFCYIVKTEACLEERVFKHTVLLNTMLFYTNLFLDECYKIQCLIQCSN